VTASFVDGTTATGTHLVGADGAKSSLRTLLLGTSQAALTPLPIVMFNFKSTYLPEQAHYLKDTFHPIMNVAIHTNSFLLTSILDMPNRNDAATWVFQIVPTVMNEDNAKIIGMSHEQRLALLKGRAKELVEPFKSAITWVIEGTEIPADVCMHWEKPVAWDNKGCRVTLAGDAAHPMVPRKSFTSLLLTCGNGLTVTCFIQIVDKDSTMPFKMRRIMSRL
jgi:2-polyprenyl-6-methoxyphenol hydroxylase-like FAD-dependent oxidoreductase